MAFVYLELSTLDLCGLRRPCSLCLPCCRNLGRIRIICPWLAPDDAFRLLQMFRRGREAILLEAVVHRTEVCHHPFRHHLLRRISPLVQIVACINHFIATQRYSQKILLTYQTDAASQFFYRALPGLEA